MRPITVTLGLLASVLLVSAAAPAQTIFYVDDDASGSSNGLSWANAFVDPELAISLAQAGDEIRIARGHYVMDGDVPFANFVDAGVTIRGGYGGVTSAWPDARSPQGWPTILDGDINGDDRPGFLNREDNKFAVLRTGPIGVQGSTPAVTLDGLHIRGARTSGIVTSISVHVIDCTLTDNSDAGLYYLSLDSGPSFTFEGTRIAGNGVTGLDIRITERDTATVRRCIVSGNGHAPGQATRGGLRIWASPTLLPSSEPSIFLEDSVFTGNLARGFSPPGSELIALAWGGGANVVGQARIKGCEFIENRAVGERAFGGGAALFASDSKDIEVANCTFDGNAVYGTTDAVGGGVYADGLSIHFQGCEITRNSASGSLTGDSCGGGAAKKRPLAGAPSIPDFFHCTIVDNQAEFEAGGIIVFGGDVRIVSSILWGNSDATGSESQAAQVTGDMVSHVSIQKNCIQGVRATAFWDNFGLDPLLSGPGGPDGVLGTIDDGYRLLPGSPCIDMGVQPVYESLSDATDLDGDGDFAEVVPIDLGGRRRSFDALPGPDNVDTGAYEFGAPLAEGLWFDRGAALGGALGEPRLTGTGDQFAGTPYALTVEYARPDATAFLVLGLTELSAPFKGGVMVPNPDVLAPLTIGPLGTFEFAATWPQFPVTEQTLWWQVWVLDPDAPFGYAATNALSSTTP